MPNYDLTNLSPRSFEHLIQAVASEIITPGLVVFGDGPDGGREAIFEERVSYPSSEENWAGYCVIQAKFKLRPNSGDDSAWLLTELKKEFSKFSIARRGLRKPEYYIVCTNVVLSAAHKSGGKDKVTRYLRKVLAGSLKDFRIWDYDQLRTYLDQLPNVRQTYAAWITSGDVLQGLISNLGFTKPDFHSVIYNFIEKQFVADEFVNLDQAGHSTDRRIRLSTVFVDLPVSNERVSHVSDEDSRFRNVIKLILNISRERLSAAKPAASDGHFQETQNLTPQIGQGQFVILGGPGQGKSTLSKFACQLFRASILSSLNPSQLLQDSRFALDDLMEQCRKEEIPLINSKRFPVRVDLNKFASFLSKTNGSQKSDLVGYLLDQIQNETGHDLKRPDFRIWLARYPWAIFLDGLDEVPTSSNRDDVLRAITNFRIDAHSLGADLGLTDFLYQS